MKGLPGRATISAIVPVFDGEAVLPRALAPLIRFLRDGAIAELIVVDDGSTDASAAVAAGLGARVIASGGRLGPAGARNRGAAIARGAILWSSCTTTRLPCSLARWRTTA